MQLLPSGMTLIELLHKPGLFLLWEMKYGNLYKGWRGTENGLRLEKECRPVQKPSGKNEDGSIKYKTTWHCDIENPTLPPVWQSEKEFFHWIGVQYLNPELRNWGKGY